MNINFFASKIDRGGASKYFIRINDALNKHNINSNLICFKNDIDNESYIENETLFKKLKYLRENINLSDNSILITNYGFETIIAKLASLGLRKKIKIVSIVHIRSVMWIPNYNNKIKVKIFKSFIKLSFFICNKCIAVSDGLMEEIINEGWIEENKIVRIYNPVIEDSFYGKEKKISKEKEINLGVIGWIWDIKNQIEIIKAIKILNNRKYKLHIIGGIKDEEYYLKLREIVKTLGLENQVIFEGIKDNIFRELEKLDILLLSSKTEALPTVIIEAMATGTPVIATDCKFGPRELLEDTCGIIYKFGNEIELANSIHKLVNNQNLYTELSKNSLKRSEKFKYRNIVKEYEKFFNSLYQ